MDSHPSWLPAHLCQQKGGAGRASLEGGSLQMWGGSGQLQASIAQRPPSTWDFQDAALSVVGRPWVEGPVKGEAQNYCWAGRWLPTETWPATGAPIWVQSSLSLLAPGLRTVQTPCQRGNNSNGRVQGWMTNGPGRQVSILTPHQQLLLASQFPDGQTEASR